MTKHMIAFLFMAAFSAAVQATVICSASSGDVVIDTRSEEPVVSSQILALLHYS